MNEKLALSDDILMKIEKPARYIGNEVNAVVKDLNSIDVRFCMCFPGCLRDRHVPSGHSDPVWHAQLLGRCLV